MCGWWLQGLVPERKVFEVHIEQGHKVGAKVVLRGEAGMSELGVAPGDVIFVLEPKPHKTFKRIGNDLILDKVRHLLAVPADCLGTHAMRACQSGQALLTLLPTPSLAWPVAMQLTHAVTQR